MAVILTTSCLFAQDYEIRMTRAAEVGEKFALTASGAMSEQVTLSNQERVLKKDAASFTAKLEGTVTVLEIDELKREIKLSLLLSHLFVSTSGETNEKEALPKGTQVVAQLRNGKEEYLVNGDVASKEIAKVLNLFISLPITKKTDDDVFGTKDRKRVGDHWPVNTANGAEALAALGVKVDADNIKGTMNFEKLVVVDGINCLQLNGKMEMSNIALPLPAGLVVESSSISTTYSGEYPVDLAIRHLSEEISLKINLMAKGKPKPDAPEITMSMNMEKSKQMKLKFLK
jgi:hypothetical protein